MEKSGIDSDLIRGHIDTIILQILKDGDRYGYEIVKDVEIKSGGTYSLKQPTLYSCLKRLEGQRKISSYWTDSDIGGKRHYYKLTEEGRNELERNRNEWLQSRLIIDKLISNYSNPQNTNNQPIEFPVEKTKTTSNENEVKTEQVEDLIQTVEEDSEIFEKEIISTDEDITPVESIEKITTAENETQSFFESETEQTENDLPDESPSVSDVLDQIETTENSQASIEDSLVEIEKQPESAETFSSTIIWDDEENDSPQTDFVLPNKADNQTEISTATDDDSSEIQFEKPKTDEESMFVDFEKQQQIAEKYFKEQLFNEKDSKDEIKQSSLLDNIDHEKEIENLLKKNEEKLENQKLKKQDLNSLANKADELEEIQKEFSENENLFEQSILNPIELEIEENIELENEESNDADTALFEENEKAANDDEMLEEFSTFEAENNKKVFNEQKFEEFKNASAEGEVKIFETSVVRNSEGLNIEKSQTTTSNNQNFTASSTTLEQTHISPNAEVTKKMYEGKQISGQFTEKEYKQILNELSSMAKGSPTTAIPIQAEPLKQIVDDRQIKIQIEEAPKDYTHIKKKFEKQGIFVRTHRKIERQTKPVKNNVLVNKLKLARTWTTFGIILIALIATYAIMNASKSIDNTFIGTFSYFLVAVLFLLAISIANTIGFWIDPQKREQAKFSAKAALLISFLFFLQIAVIIYAINLQLGLTSFSQANYNHLNWIVPFVTSFAVVVSPLIQLILFNSKKFHV